MQSRHYMNNYNEQNARMFAQTASGTNELQGLQQQQQHAQRPQGGEGDNKMSGSYSESLQLNSNNNYPYQ